MSLPSTPWDHPLRSYQQRFVEEIRSGDGNSLVCLPTGSGKTMIAVQAAKMAKERFPNRFTIFLAPTVALLQQQMDTFASHQGSNFCVMNLGGGRSLGMSWAEAAIHFDVIFFTPQSCLNQMKPGQLSISRHVNMIIFDEFHHAVKEHPYRKITEAYGKSSIRPKIVGLSACPIVGKCDWSTANNLRKLCKIFHAELLYVEAHSELEQDLHKHTPAPSIELTETNYLDILREAFSPEEDEDEEEEEEDDDEDSKMLVDSRDPKLKPLAIVFCQRRDTCVKVFEQIKSHPALSDVEVDVVVGHNNKKGDVRMSESEVKERIARFRRHETNILVATSVLEEGIDVPSCNLVIRTDVMHCLKQLVQSRGRARFPTSRYVVYCSNAAELRSAEQLLQQEVALNDSIQRLGHLLDSTHTANTFWNGPEPQLSPEQVQPKPQLPQLPQLPGLLSSRIGLSRGSQTPAAVLTDPPELPQMPGGTNFKGMLNEYIQKRGKNPDEILYVSRQLPGSTPHEPLFITTVRFPDTVLEGISATGHIHARKKDSEQSAAWGLIYKMTKAS